MRSCLVNSRAVSSCGSVDRDQFSQPDKCVLNFKDMCKSCQVNSQLCPGSLFIRLKDQRSSLGVICCKVSLQLCAFPLMLDWG